MCGKGMTVVQWCMLYYSLCSELGNAIVFEFCWPVNMATAASRSWGGQLLDDWQWGWRKGWHISRGNKVCWSWFWGSWIL